MPVSVTIPEGITAVLRDRPSRIGWVNLAVFRDDDTGSREYTTTADNGRGFEIRIISQQLRKGDTITVTAGSGESAVSADWRLTTAVAPTSDAAPAADVAPTSDAGPDLTGAPGESVTLQAIDGNRNGAAPELTYSWAQASGPAVTLSDTTAVNPSFTVPSAAADGTTLEFQLTVTDQEGESDSDTVAVTVTVQRPDNTPPVVAELAPVRAFAGETVRRPARPVTSRTRRMPCPSSGSRRAERQRPPWREPTAAS